ncbi:hypothetical protein GSI_05840 [Ganoderma sinense ZZ0214-1]|uniref:Uncharacterized protein n=1 Tax=Ganoderma sinense ZZ0214-1 TaxID=1077348 RepID=A0A2G8SBK3_9APHY|nr:hypothetical protein GSI_05840 [Ganoderma sinense ZZ0214-1]
MRSAYTPSRRSAYPNRPATMSATTVRTLARRFKTSPASSGTISARIALLARACVGRPSTDPNDHDVTMTYALVARPCEQNGDERTRENANGENLRNAVEHRGDRESRSCVCGRRRPRLAALARAGQGGTGRTDEACRVG